LFHGCALGVSGYDWREQWVPAKHLPGGADAAQLSAAPPSAVSVVNRGLNIRGLRDTVGCPIERSAAFVNVVSESLAISRRACHPSSNAVQLPSTPTEASSPAWTADE
jgi:hypothetical protein